MLKTLTLVYLVFSQSQLSFICPELKLPNHSKVGGVTFTGGPQGPWEAIMSTIVRQFAFLAGLLVSTGCSVLLEAHKQLFSRLCSKSIFVHD